MRDQFFVAIDIFGLLVLIVAFGIQIYTEHRRKQLSRAVDENQPRVERISGADQNKRSEPPQS
jgi:hypothetical protein